MKKYINRLILAAASILLGAGSAMAQDVLTIEGSVKNATVAVYKAAAKPTGAPTGATVTTIAPGEWIIFKVTPESGYWTYADILTIQPAGSIGGAEARPSRAIILPEHPIALSGNEADGTGCYYMQIPAEWKNADGYIKVIIGGEAIEKIDLSSATLSGSGTTVTTADRADGWKATITLDEISWTYDKNAHCPAISTFTLTNGTKSFTNTAAQVAISGAQTNAGNHNATLSAVTGGCFVNSKSVSFSIAKAATAITLNTPPGGGEVGQMDVGDTYTSGATLSPTDAGSLTISLSKESVVTVDADGVITAVGEGEVTITFSFSGNENYAAAESKTMKIQVSKVPTEITVAPANPEWGDTWQLKVLDECATGATLTPAEAGILSYSSSDESVAKVVDGKIKAFAEGTATITVSFAGNTKYAAAESKTIAVNVSLNDASVSVDKNSVELLVDETHTIIPTTTPDGLGVTYTPDASGVVSVDASGKVTALKEGNATITVSVGGDGAYKYNAVTVNVHVTKVLNEDDIVLTIPTDGYIYDGTPKTPAVTVKVGDKTLVQGTDYNVSYSNNVNAGENTATVTVTDIDGGDYNVSGTKKFSIAKAPLTITAQDQEYVYNGYPQGEGDVVYADPAEFATKVSVTGLQGTDALFSFILNGTKTEVGDYASAIELSSVVIKKGDTDVTANYDFTLVAGKLTITQKEVGLTWGTTSFNYDGNSHAPSATVTGLVNSDDVSATVAISANSGSSLTDGKAVNVGGYTATVTKLTGTKADNYKLPATGLTQTFNINASDAASAVVTANDLTYDGTAQDLVTIGTITYGATGTAADIVFYESATSTTPLTAVPQGNNAGSYDVFYEVTPDINHSAPARSQVTVTIKKKALTITAKPQSVTLGTAITQTTDQVTAEGLVAGHTLDAVTLTQSTTDVTTSGTITPSGATVKSGDTNVTDNYDITYVAGTLTVKAFKVSVSVVETGSGENLEGATVQVLDGEGNVIDQWVSIGSAHVVDGLKNGIEYILRETIAPDGYVLCTQYTFIISSDGKITTTGTMTDEGVLLVENDKSKVEISVVDIANGENLEGATVQVLDSDGNVIDEWVSTKGNHRIEGLKTGVEYTIKETVAPGDYVLPTETKFTIDESGKVTSTGTMTAEGVLLVENGKIPTVASAVVTANNRDYNGTPQNLVTIGTITGGATGTAADVVFYEDATSTTPLTAVPQGTNASTYDVYYEVTPDGDHTAPSRAKITVTISPITASVTITGHNNTTTYDGNEHSVSGYDVEISTPLYTEADFTFSGTATAKRTEVGMTTMGLTAEQFTNTSTNFSSVTFNVTDGFQTITSPDAVIVMITGHSNTADYDGKEHSVSGYDVKINNPLYTEADFTFSGTAKAARTDAGTTQMGLAESQFTNTNTNFNVTFSVTDGYQTISPIAAVVTITGHNNTVTYDGNEHSVTGYDVTFSNNLYQESDFTFSGKAEAKRTDEGTTQMGLAEEQFKNVSPNFDPVTFTVTDGYQTITSVTDVVVTITGHSSTVDYDGTEHSVSGYDVQISNPLYKETNFTFSGTALVARTDAGTTNMGLDAAQFTNNNTDFTNVTFKVTDGYQTINPITATVTIEGHYDMAVYDGTAHSVTGYDVTFSNDLYKQTDFTFSGTASAAQTDKGTAYMGLADNQFANISANFSKVTFNVIDGYQTIIPAVLTVTADALEKAFGTDDPTLTYTVTGLRGSDALTGSPERATGETVGSYAISQGTLKASDNYTLTFNGANLVIYRALDGIFVEGCEWATFVAEEDLTIPAGLEAYVVSSVSGTTVSTEAAAFVAKGVGILLKRADKMVNSYRGYAYDGTAAPPTSLLQGSATSASDIQTYKDYVLYNDQFELAGVSSVDKGHAYLPQAVLGGAAGARSLTIIGIDGTGIRAIVFDDAGTEDNWYDLNGRKLNGKPTKKGLYIKDGHKVVIK